MKLTKDPFVYGFVLRLALTPVLFLFTDDLMLMAAALLVMDVMDCAFAALMNWVRVAETSKFYQIGDKFMDLFQYFVALCIVRDAPPGLSTILWALWAWRAVGVARFAYTADERVLVLHFDATKELLAAQACMPAGKLLPPELILLLCAGKVLFEAWKNGDPRRFYEIKDAVSPAE